MKIKKIYPFALTGGVTMLSAFAMLRSTYLTNGGFPTFAAGTVLCCLVLLTMYKLFGVRRALFGAALATVVSLGNITALPMLYYTDGFSHEEVAATANKTLVYLILMYGSMIVAGIILHLLNKLNTNKPIWLFIGAAAITLLAAAAIFFLSDVDSGTTLIFDIQAAIPAAAVMLLCAAFAVSAAKLFKVLCAAALIVLTCSLVIRNETGIPAVFIVALLLWYLFFSKKRAKIITFFAVLLPVMAAAGVLFLKHFGDRFSGITIVDKVMTRLFSGNVVQTASALRSLRQSGIFGTNSYLYLSEGTSDFCMVTLIHYLGIAFLLLVVLSAVPFFCMSAGELIRERFSLANTVASMSLCLLAVILIYNLMMCVGIVPIIGVQAPFVGNSMTFSILSGILLGWSCFSEDEADKLNKKIKDIRSEIL